MITLYFQFMHCFEGHCVTTLGEITSKEGSRHGIQELESINRLVQVRKQLNNYSFFRFKTLPKSIPYVFSCVTFV